MLNIKAFVFSKYVNKIWSQPLIHNQINCSKYIKLHRLPIFISYRFTSLICKTALNSVSVHSAHFYHFFGGLLNTELPITSVSFKWLTAPYWHEINIRKGDGWPHWMIWRCEQGTVSDKNIRRLGQQDRKPTQLRFRLLEHHLLQPIGSESRTYHLDVTNCCNASDKEVYLNFCCSI